MTRMNIRSVCLAGALLGLVGVPVVGTAGVAPTLDECMAAAWQVNPDLKSATARLAAARAAVKEANSAYYPQVGLAGNWMRTDNPPQAFFMSLNQRRASLEKDFNHPDDIENARGSIVAQWRLYDGGRREADRRAARLGAESLEHSLESIRNDLAYEITKAYCGVLQARAFVAVREEAARSISESLRVATERFNAGGAIKTDVLNLEVQHSQATEDVIHARNGLQLAAAVLNTTIGRDMLQATDLPDLPDPAEARTEAAPSVESRPEWRAAQSRIRMAEAMATRARREYGPVVNAFGSVDWDSEPFHGAEQSYVAGAAVELNLFDGFRTRAGLARASAELVEAQALADKTRKMLELDLVQSRLNEQEARERLVVAAKTVASAEEALRITAERYKQGSADITELMAAQSGLTATRARSVAARYDSLIARANVERAGGVIRGWSKK